MLLISVMGNSHPKWTSTPWASHSEFYLKKKKEKKRSTHLLWGAMLEHLLSPVMLTTSLAIGRVSPPKDEEGMARRTRITCLRWYGVDVNLILISVLMLAFCTLGPLRIFQEWAANSEKAEFKCADQGCSFDSALCSPFPSPPAEVAWDAFLSYIVHLALWLC